MKITMTADDFGWSADTVAATIECLQKGVVTNASLMPGMPSTANAIEFARTNPGFCYGVHLTLAGDGCERPVSSPREVPDLVDSNGCFLSASVIRRRALFKALDPRQIEQEVRAQLDLIRASGVEISYVDSHKHIHKLPLIGNVILVVLRSFGIKRVRRVQNLFDAGQWSKPTFWIGWLLSRQIVSNFRTTDLFYMPTHPGSTNWEHWLVNRVQGDSRLEIGIHPGFSEDWRRAETLAAERFVSAVRGQYLIGSWTSIAP